jgi:hypothetical protein
MASALRRSLFRVSPILRESAAATERKESISHIKKEARKNPELYVCDYKHLNIGIMEAD